jgi:basic membrane lipoprotein Med (substrate-binding protein (PBP1-ABC) superfamily)
LSAPLALTALLAAILILGLQLGRPAGAQTTEVGLVLDLDLLSEGGLSWLSHEGLVRANNELGIVGKVYVPRDHADFEPLLQECAEDRSDLCIAVGFMAGEAISNVAAANVDTSFAIVDTAFESYPDNLRGMIFAADEAGYLAGTLAGLMTESDVVGSVAGMEIPPITAFVEPYVHAAQCANPDVTAIVTYTWDFGDPYIGARAAQELISKGADVIFGVGGSMGVGAVVTATQSGAWGIGVDVDQYLTVFTQGTVTLPGSDKILSSAMKRVDNAVFDTIADVVSGTFTSGTVVYDLESEGVGLAPFHEADPFVSQSVRDVLAQTEKGIIGGTIDVNGPCPVYYFLPVVMLEPAS